MGFSKLARARLDKSLYNRIRYAVGNPTRKFHEAWTVGNDLACRSQKIRLWLFAGLVYVLGGMDLGRVVEFPVGLLWVFE